MVVKAEAIYEGGTYELTRNNQTGNYYAQVRAKKREPPTDEPYSYYPVMLRVTDDAGNVSIYTISDATIGNDLLLIVREEQIFPLKFIVANENGEELGFVKDANLIDLEIGDTNDFELELSADAWSPEMYNWGYRIFIPGTEYGGLLEDRKTSTSSNTVTWMGYTWRGLLSQKIIQPPEGEAYLTVSGDANEIISEVLGDRFGPLFVADEDPAGIQISNFQFDRYCTLLDGLDKMLAGAGARLKIYYQQGDPGGMNGAVHLICAGSGEEEERTILHLYLQEDGSVGETPFYTGVEEREALYSYTSAEDMDKLTEDGTNRLLELANYTEMDATIDNVDVDIGDIVGGRDRLTGMSLKQPVERKILKTQNGKTTVEYKLKGEE